MSRKKIDIVIEKIGIFFDSKRDNPKKPKPPVIDLLIATKLSQILPIRLLTELI